MSGDSTADIGITQDSGLRAHWVKALGPKLGIQCSRISDVPSHMLKTSTRVWVDMSLPNLAKWSDSSWGMLLKKPAIWVIATSSIPRDAEGVDALDAGCAGYCHAYADAATLVQVAQVVSAGHVWVGPQLMQRLIREANHAATLKTGDASAWSQGFTPREREVAKLAAKGLSNQEIAQLCDISERTVKAHLSSAFGKLGVADRLQLTLKVHGIQ